MSYGINEVLLSSVLGASVFSFFAAQPLVIVGVTGPITMFNSHVLVTHLIEDDSNILPAPSMTSLLTAPLLTFPSWRGSASGP